MRDCFDEDKRAHIRALKVVVYDPIVPESCDKGRTSRTDLLAMLSALPAIRCGPHAQETFSVVLTSADEQMLVTLSERILDGIVAAMGRRCFDDAYALHDSVVRLLVIAHPTIDRVVRFASEGVVREIEKMVAEMKTQTHAKEFAKALSAVDAIESVVAMFGGCTTTGYPSNSFPSPKALKNFLYVCFSPSAVSFPCVLPLYVFSIPRSGFYMFQPFRGYPKNNSEIGHKNK